MENRAIQRRLRTQIPSQEQRAEGLYMHRALEAEQEIGRRLRQESLFFGRLIQMLQTDVPGVMNVCKLLHQLRALVGVQKIVLFRQRPDMGFFWALERVGFGPGEWPEFYTRETPEMFCCICGGRGETAWGEFLQREMGVKEAVWTWNRESRLALLLIGDGSPSIFGPMDREWVSAVLRGIVAVERQRRLSHLAEEGLKIQRCGAGCDMKEMLKAVGRCMRQLDISYHDIGIGLMREEDGAPQVRLAQLRARGEFEEWSVSPADRAYPRICREMKPTYWRNLSVEGDVPSVFGVPGEIGSVIEWSFNGGFLSLTSLRSDPHSHVDLELMRGVVDLLSEIFTGWESGENRLREERLGCVARMLCGEQKPLWHCILEKLGEMLQVDRTHLILCSADSRTAKRAYAWQRCAHAGRKDESIALSSCSWLIRRHERGRNVVIRDVQNARADVADVARALRARQTCALLAVPIFSTAGELAGSIVFEDCTKERSWRRWEIEIARTVARMAGYRLEQS